MKRKSKGQLAREAKLTQRETRAVNDILKDPWFNSLPVPAQIRITGFIKKKVDQNLEVYETLGYEKGMLDCMTCVLQVLIEDYWPKAAKKKLHKFVYDVSDLMNSHLREVVTWEEMREYIKDKTGMEIIKEFKGEDKRPTPNDLFGGVKDKPKEGNHKNH